MTDNTDKIFDQAAAFQKLWMDSLTEMAGIWSQYSAGSPPIDEMRKMRGGMLQVLAETWDEYMRTPQFMEMMKASLNGALDLKRLASDGMNRVHEQFKTPSKEDIDEVLLAIRHVERRILDRLEGLDDRLAKLDEGLDDRLAKLDEGLDDRVAKLDEGLDHRVAKLFEGLDHRVVKLFEGLNDRLAKLDEKIHKVDQGIAKKENAIERRGQTSKTKAQKHGPENEPEN